MPPAGPSFGGALVSGRAIQSVRTAVVMEDGQTLAIGGLIQTQVTASITKVPMIGDIPFLGPLFSSKSFQEQETEVVVLVTPHLVDPMDCCDVPKYLPGQETRSPDDFELYLENILEAPRGSREVNHGNRYVPAYKNGPTAKQFPCISAARGPDYNCPGCNGGPSTGIPLPHDYLQQPGPVPPHPAANVFVQEPAPPAAPMPSAVQPVSATEGAAPVSGPAPAAPMPSDTPVNLPPVSSVPLTPDGSR